MKTTSATETVTTTRHTLSDKEISEIVLKHLNCTDGVLEWDERSCGGIRGCIVTTKTRTVEGGDQP